MWEKIYLKKRAITAMYLSFVMRNIKLKQKILKININ